MKKRLNDWLKIIKKKTIIETDRIHIQFLCVYAVFVLLSVVMSIVNFLTDCQLLLMATMLFAVLCTINFLLTVLFKKTEFTVRIIFSVELISLFTFFIITGEPEGFSAIWVCLFPVAGMLLYRRKYGSVLSACIFVVLVFFFWIPYGKQILMYEYTASFMLRFPILYLAFFLIGFLFETIRSLTQKELVRLSEKFRKLSYTDQLTGLGNETYYFRTTEMVDKSILKDEVEFAIAVMDVNAVKAINDKFGHRFGCHLIVTAGKKLPSIFPKSRLFHVGGDEFVAIITGDDYKHIEERIEDFHKKLTFAKTSFENTELPLSVAIGYSVYEHGDKYNDVFQRADKLMYEEKEFVKEKYHIQAR